LGAFITVKPRVVRFRHRVCSGSTPHPAAGLQKRRR
jgi:hypothetical protein